MLRGTLLLVVATAILSIPVLGLADSHDPQRIMATEVMAKINSGEAVLFLDTRNTRDWKNAKVMIPDAIRIGSNEILTKVAKETPKDKLIVTYCT